MKNQSSMSLPKKSLLAVVILVCAIAPATMSAGQGPSSANAAGQAPVVIYMGLSVWSWQNQSIRKSSRRAMKLTPGSRRTFRLPTGQFLAVRS